MPRVRLRSSSSEDDGELPPETQKFSPEQRDSEVRALQLLRAKAKETLEKKIPANKSLKPSNEEGIESESKKSSVTKVQSETTSSTSSKEVLENHHGPSTNEQVVKVEDIAIPQVPPLPSTTPPVQNRKSRSRDSSSSGSDSDR